MAAIAKPEPAIIHSIKHASRASRAPVGYWANLSFRIDVHSFGLDRLAAATANARYQTIAILFVFRRLVNAEISSATVLKPCVFD